MSARRAFRFGVVAALATSGDDWVSKVQRIESLGFSTVVVPDGLRYTLAPFPALAAAAAATRTLRVGTYVVANDYRHPVMLAKDAASVDLLSNGRFEFGIGAGRPGAGEDQAMMGQPFDSGSVRLARLAEGLSILRPLLSGETVTLAGRYYQVENAQALPAPLQKPPPILIAASGRQMLALAGREADIVALGLPPTASEAEAAEKIGWLREAAGPRFDQIELNLNVMAVGDRVPRYLQMQMGLTAEKLAQGGALSALTGSPDEMCATLERRRDQFGISYIMVGEELVDGLAPVVERLVGR
ncbi:MAG TPA: TIGR03621 family F420-dependent LLM class oxidoreductase [Chloroflexota bacterium]|nr:TIGR03621 family F420-dependent LLM class oxidoreductase [Chloroflexota bacterium]